MNDRKEINAGERSVLVVDPNWENRRQLTDLLRVLKHTDIYTPDPPCALGTAENRRFDVVFCAYAISEDMNGIQLLERILEVSARRPPAGLVLVSRKPVRDLRIGGKITARLLQEPFTVAELQRVLPYHTPRPNEYYRRRG